MILSRTFRSIPIYRLYTHANFLRQCKWFLIRFALELIWMLSEVGLHCLTLENTSVPCPCQCQSLFRGIWVRSNIWGRNDCLAHHTLQSEMATHCRQTCRQPCACEFFGNAKSCGRDVGMLRSRKLPNMVNSHWPLPNSLEKTSKSGFHKRRNRKSSGMSRFMREREIYIYINRT